MNDELSDDIRKTFILPLTIELQDHIENGSYNPPLATKFCWHLEKTESEDYKKWING